MESADRSSVWPYDEHGKPREFYYQRYAHPTGAAAEEALGALEGGNALLFSSGTAAGTACVFALLGPGSTVALAAGAYFGTGVTLREFDAWGLKVVEFDQTGAPPADADVVWLESPSNPLLSVPNWEAARAHGAPIVCDATASTPVYLKPLDEGATVVLHSATKFLTGHHDAMLGALATRDAELHTRLREVRTRIGLHAAPDACESLLRGLKTLGERMPKHTENATEIARRLAAHPAVVLVRYPGFGGLISFDVAGDPVPVETATRLIANQTSLGGVTSSMESRYRWEGDRIPVGLLRLSVGLEDVDEIWADLERALQNA
ncbi:MAG TPA: PLP-dependent transferase [Gaiellaceae bacterium]|jgi:cystathionine gamma-synthase